MQHVLPRLGAFLTLLLVAGSAPGIASLARAAPPPDLSLLDLIEIELGYTTLAEQYYRKVPPQRLLDGARDGLLAYERSRGIRAPNVAVMHARPDGRGAVPAIEREVALAITRYGSRVRPRDLAYATIRGETAALGDAYTVFFTKDELKRFTGYVEGETFGGIGVVIGIDDTTTQWRADQVFAGGPAARAGMVTGDLIAGVDGTATRGLPVDRASTLLRGVSGTVVRLAIVRDGVALGEPLAVTRAAITPPSVIARLIPPDIGYITLRTFAATAGRDVRDAAQRLRSLGAHAIAFDLRDNGGGYESAAVGVASDFIASGPLVTVQSRRGQRRTSMADGKALSPLPLAVLVNRNSASGSELVSGAIQDRGAGTVVGTRTYGKGLVQTIVPLPDGAALKVTTARYFTPSGRDIDRVGITPDVAVDEPSDARRGVPGADAQLDRAIELLHERIAAATSKS